MSDLAILLKQPENDSLPESVGLTIGLRGLTGAHGPVWPSTQCRHTELETRHGITYNEKIILEQQHFKTHLFGHKLIIRLWDVTIKISVHCISQRSILPVLEYPVNQHGMVFFIFHNRPMSTHDLENKYAKGKYISKRGWLACAC
uniref:Uncharacterized protein n=1 Tax=Oryza glumipatula TaxID=40148 RepID=A0A0E0BIZ8_9ORYZ